MTFNRTGSEILACQMKMKSIPITLPDLIIKSDLCIWIETKWVQNHFEFALNFFIGLNKANSKVEHQKCMK